MLGAIVAFGIRVVRLEVKVKVGQNRLPADQQSMINALDQIPDAADLLKLTSSILSKTPGANT